MSSKFETVIKAEKIKKVDLAKKAGCAQSYISLIATGRRRPSPDVALAIVEAIESILGDRFNGQLTVNDLLYPEDPKAN